MSVLIAMATALLSAAVLLGLAAIAGAKDDASRAAVGDLVFFACVGLLILWGIARGSAVVVDAVLLASLLGILATVALARILTRGRR